MYEAESVRNNFNMASDSYIAVKPVTSYHISAHQRLTHAVIFEAHLRANSPEAVHKETVD